MSRTLFMTFTAGALLCACGSNKTSVDSSAAVEQQEANNGFSTGRVTTAFAGDGCPVLIRVDHADNLYLIPIALDDKYKQNGLQLTFKYRPSKASSGDCRKGSPAVIEEVSVVPATPQSKPKSE
jgi:hypothetical protein